MFEGNPFAAVHRLAAQRRTNREDALLPIAHQRSRIVALEAALRNLIQVGDRLKLAQASSLWHEAARDAERVLNS